MFSMDTTDAPALFIHFINFNTVRSLGSQQLETDEDIGSSGIWKCDAVAVTCVRRMSSVRQPIALHISQNDLYP